MWRWCIIALLLMAVSATPHGPVDLDTLFAERTPFQDALHAVERVQTDLDGIQYRLGLAYLGACLGDGVEVNLRVNGAVAIMAGFQLKHEAGIAQVWRLADGNPDVPPIQDLSDWLDILLQDAERWRAETERWSEAATQLGSTPIMEWKALFDALLETDPMTLPASGYDVYPVPNSTGDVTDFPFYVDLSLMSADWWAAIDTTDWTKGRAAIHASETELATEWKNVNTGAKTGQLFVKWNGVIGTTGTHGLRVYPPMAANASVAADATYGSQAVWSAVNALWHLDEDPASGAPQYGDSTGNGHNGTASNVSRVASPLGFGAQQSSSETSGGSVTVPNNDALHVLDNFTISALIRIDTWPTTNKIPYAISVYDASSSLRSWGLQLRGPTAVNGNSWAAWLSTDGATGTASPPAPYEAKASLDDAAWHWVQMKRTGSTFYIYLDGSQVFSGTFSGTLFDTSADLVMFRRANSTETCLASMALAYICPTFRDGAWSLYEASNLLDASTFWGTPTWTPPPSSGTPYYYNLRRRAN